MLVQECQGVPSSFLPPQQRAARAQQGVGRRLGRRDIDEEVLQQGGDLRYHVSPATQAPLAYFLRRLGTQWPREPLLLSMYKCTRFDIIAVLYTCTTVASRVAANARVLTHARRSLWHRRLTHHTHTSTHLNVPQPRNPEPLVYINS